ncbi:MAG: DUF4340 domain-containing protein [Planctomycetes bacterium]|nr:DUF4340 domain-containing protein [Planctomycetota bacterium]
MKPKQLYIMLATLVGLVVLSVISDRTPVERPISEQAKLVNLMPAGISADKVTAIEFVVNDNADEKKAEGDAAKTESFPVLKVVRLNGSDWVVATAWDAPANKEMIDSFLKTLIEMKGDFVSDREERQDEYQVSEKKGLKVNLYAGAGASPAFSMYIGSNRGSDASLVRLAGDKTVYSIGKSLRSELAMWDGDTKPSRRKWIHREVIKVDKADIAKLDITYPDHILSFEKVEKKNDAKEGEDKAAPARAEYEWKLVSGGTGDDFKKDMLDRLVDNVFSFEVDDVVDPGKKKELGLNEPVYDCIVTLKDGKTVGLSAVRDGKGDKAYLYTKDKQDRLYQVSTWTFDNLFMSGVTLFGLKAPTIEKEKILSLSLKHGDKIISVKRKDKDSKWELVAPQTGFQLKQLRVDEIAEKLSKWEVADYTDPKGMVQFGFSLPVCTLDIGLEGGESRTMLLGLDHPGLDGAYVSVGAKDSALVMKSEDVKGIFADLNDVLDFGRSIVPAKFAEADAIAVSDGPASFSLTSTKDEKGNQIWTLDFAGKKDVASTETVDKYLAFLGGLKATGIVGKKDEAETDALPRSVKITVGEESFELKMGAETDSGVVLTLSHETLPVILSKSDADKLMPKPAGFIPEKKPEIEIPPVAEPEEKGKPVSVTKTIKNPFEEE